MDSSSVPPVVNGLRFIGLLNAAIWAGASIYFSFILAPTFDGGVLEEKLGFLTKVIQLKLSKTYLTTHQVCAVVAIVHFLSEWLYSAKPLMKRGLYLSIALFTLALSAGQFIQPKMEKTYVVKFHAERDQSEDAEAAGRLFRFWNGTFKALNLALLGGVVFHFWLLSKPSRIMRSSYLDGARG